MGVFFPIMRQIFIFDILNICLMIGFFEKDSPPRCRMIENDRDFNINGFFFKNVQKCEKMRILYLNPYHFVVLD